MAAVSSLLPFLHHLLQWWLTLLLSLGPSPHCGIPRFMIEMEFVFSSSFRNPGCVPSTLLMAKRNPVITSNLIQIIISNNFGTSPGGSEQFWDLHTPSRVASFQSISFVRYGLLRLLLLLLKCKIAIMDNIFLGVSPTPASVLFLC